MNYNDGFNLIGMISYFALDECNVCVRFLVATAAVPTCQRKVCNGNPEETWRGKGSFFFFLLSRKRSTQIPTIGTISYILRGKGNKKEKEK